MEGAGEPAQQRLGVIAAQLRHHRARRPTTPAKTAGAGSPQGPTITATVPLTKVPEWASLERQLFQQMEEAIHPYLLRPKLPKRILNF